MAFALALLPLFGCVAPPVLDSVEEKLADRVVAVAEPQIRLFVGIAGVIAETCIVDRMSEYTFVGEAAGALNVVAAEVTESESGTKTWEFPNAGIDGTQGDLVLTTDSERSSFSVSYTAPNNTLLSGSYHILNCDPPAATALLLGDTGAADTGAADTADTAGDTGDTGTPSGAGYTVNVSGSLDATTTSETDLMEIDGDKPYSALTWAPPTAIAPIGGWVNWADAVLATNVEDTVTLEGASNIDYTSRTWPAKASGTRWARSVSIGLP